ncbi:MAG TPA: PDZ domain-containing protein [Thermoanaerobaculia bacterium]|nr:PDZ domain-containing protein [Thermoanaerobaculia bacterium]
MKKDRFSPLPGLVALLIALASPLSASAQPDGDSRMLHTPDVSRDRIVFVYAGDVWIVPRAGGEARRLTSHPGQELFPKLSPDGRQVAFSGEYTGTRQVYVVSADGGEPRQLTFRNDIGELPLRGGYDNVILDWTPDGKKIVFRANRTGYDERLGRPYTVPAAGGMEEPLRMPEGGAGTFSPDGGRFAYTPISREFRNWKRHRGGRTPDVWIYDFAKDTAEQITKTPENEMWPVWMGDQIFFASDKDHTLNLFAYDLRSKAATKVTNGDWDVLWPSGGPDAIVYEAGGWIWLFDPQRGETAKVPIRVSGDFPEAVPSFVDLSKSVEAAQPSPTGKRALLTARGDLFTVPAEKGEIRNLTATPGIREMSASWSRDGKWIAYLSDRSGEYEVYVRPADGNGAERRVTTDGDVWRFAPVWSPDSKKLAFGDKKARLRIVDVETGKVRDADSSRFGTIELYRWSPDGRFLAYPKTGANHLNSIWIYALDEGKARQLTDSGASDFEPVWDPRGRYLYFLSNRDFTLTFSGFETQYLYTDPTRVYVGTLAKDTPALFPPQSDEESTGPSKTAETPKLTKIQIDFDGFDGRVRAIPGDSGAYRSLSASTDAVFYLKQINPRTTQLFRYGLEAREEKSVLARVDDYTLSADGKKILFAQGGGYGFVDAVADQKTDEKLDLSHLQVRSVPREEWAQIYRDAARLVRDWFYDPNLHGRDWPAIIKRYGELMPYLSSRNDLDWILNEILAELGAGHTYLERRPEWSPVERKDGGLLGAEIVADPSGYFRIAEIFPGENWHEDFRSPLTESGVHAEEGELILSVDGISTKGTDNFYRLLENKGGRTVTLLLNKKPTTEGAHEEKVSTITSEQNLRYLAWVDASRRRVEKATGGRIGYIHLPNTAVEGNRELFKHFYPQVDKEALILDDRYNGGGFIPDSMIALLSRPLLNYWVRRGEEPGTTPDFVNPGPKACLINWSAGSGGDAFPYYFKKMGLGPLIGTRTWGGLIGLSGNPPLMDGGFVLVPQFRFLDTDGNWAVENEGVSPDIEVIDRPDLVAKGQDPTLEKAIEVLLAELAKNPRKKVVVPSIPAPRE